MLKTIAFTAYMEPVAKGRPRFCRSGHVFTPPKTVKAEEEIQKACMMMKPPKPWTGAVQLSITIRRSIPKSWTKDQQRDAREGLIRPTSTPDWDNYGKLVSDALNGLFYEDDAQVVDAMVSKHYTCGTPRVEVKVTGDDGGILL